MTTRLSHPFLRVILFFALLFAGILPVATPTPAFAASIAQGTDTAEATLVEYYESDSFEIDGETGYVTLSLYDDSTFDLYLESETAGESLTVYGDYEQTDESVLLTILGADGEELDESIELEFVYDADDSLLLAGSEGGIFGEQDVILYWTDVAEAEAGDDVDDVEAEEVAIEIGGIYISPIQSEDNVIYVLNLADSGDASLSSDYLDLTPPVFELGTWTDNGDETVTVEITGTVEEEYEEVITLEFALGANGELIISDIPLYPAALLDNLSAASSGDEISDEESDVIVYYAEITPPSETESIYVYMWLYGDGTVILADEEETGSVYGEWTYEDGVLSATILNDGEADLEEAVSLVFELQEDDSLVAIEYPTDVFGEDGLIFYPAESSEESVDEAADGEGVFYYYESDELELGEEVVVISLVLSGDNSAIVGSSFEGDEEPYLEYGEWAIDADGFVVVTVSEGPDGEVYETPYVFTFEEDPDDYSLTLVGETVEVFGEIGLVLNRTE